MKMMNSVMKELGYDAKKMPLGKISKATITKACATSSVSRGGVCQGYEILKEIAGCFEEGVRTLDSTCADSGARRWQKGGSRGAGAALFGLLHCDTS